MKHQHNIKGKTGVNTFYVHIAHKLTAIVYMYVKVPQYNYGGINH